jgi:hypothetical protein
MKDLRQAPGQRAKALLQQDDPPIPGIAAAIAEEGILARPPVSASRLTEAAAAGTPGSTRRRWPGRRTHLGDRGQLGPDRDTTVGRHTGARY